MAKLSLSRLSASTKVVILLSSVFVAVVVGAGAFYATRPDSPSPSQEREYRGYEQGSCPDGKYEAWNGGAPTGDPSRDNTCLTKAQIDDREELFRSGGTLKPAVFLYADKDTEFQIGLDFGLTDSFIYPDFNVADKSWKGTVLGGQNGNLLVDQKEYDYLFWEGMTDKDYKLTEGNVVPREQTIQFLEDSLRTLGLNAREAGDFITFWGPKLTQNDYNLISFVNDEYAAAHPLTVTPTPDYTLRVFMVYRPVDRNYQIPQQKFTPAQPRHGFSLIEWGGTEQQSRSN